MAEEQIHVYEIDPAMAMGMPIGPDEIKIYLNEDNTISFNIESAKIIHNILGKWLAER